MEEVSICPACKETRLVEKFSCEDYTVSHETFRIVQCQSCDLRITTPRPNQNHLADYYISEDYISHSGKAKTLIDRIYLLARHFTLRQKLKLVTRLAKNPGQLLDYGCGTGEFLATCQKKGWAIDGVEPSEAARKKAHETLSIELNSSIETIHQSYDVITLWHVLEHVNDLSTTLKKLSDRLNANGTIVVAVPNYKSYDGNYYKEYWAGFDVPRHLWHFSQGSMSSLLQKNSLRIHEIKPMKLDSFYISLLSEKYKWRKQTFAGMIRAFVIGVISNIKARTTGNYSSLIYIIKK